MVVEQVMLPYYGSAAVGGDIDAGAEYEAYTPFPGPAIRSDLDWYFSLTIRGGRFVNPEVRGGDLVILRRLKRARDDCLSFRMGGVAIYGALAWIIRAYDVYGRGYATRPEEVNVVVR